MDERRERERDNEGDSCQKRVHICTHDPHTGVYDMMVSSTEFEKLFNKFKAETGSVFRIKSSCSVAYENSRRKRNFIPSHFKFVTVRYCCVHYGHPKMAGQGIRTKQRSVEAPNGLPSAVWCI